MTFKHFTAVFLAAALVLTGCSGGAGNSRTDCSG